MNWYLKITFKGKVIFKYQFIITAFLLIFTVLLPIFIALLLEGNLTLFAFHQNLRTCEHCSFVQFATSPNL